MEGPFLEGSVFLDLEVEGLVVVVEEEFGEHCVFFDEMVSLLSCCVG